MWVYSQAVKCAVVLCFRHVECQCKEISLTRCVRDALEMRCKACRSCVWKVVVCIRCWFLCCHTAVASGKAIERWLVWKL
jgi:hypothetical protein